MLRRAPGRLLLASVPALTLILIVTPGFAASAGAETPALPRQFVEGGDFGDLLRSLEPPSLRALAEEVLARNPELARARARAAAAAAKAPQVSSLPDPEAAVHLFLLPPETRVGPQRFSLSLSQDLPAFGELALREREALLGAVAAEAEAEAMRLEKLTEARRLFLELAFLAERERILGEERMHLHHHEEAARAGYASGLAEQKEVLRAQAGITHREEALLALEGRRQSLLAALGALCDAPAVAPEGLELPPPRRLEASVEALRSQALAHRFEVAAAEAKKAQAAVGVELAANERRPDWTLRLAYTQVDRRSDPAGRASPPPDDGDDVLALSASARLPVRGGRLDAMAEEAAALERAAEAHAARVRAEIEAEVGEAASRLPLLFDQWRLLDGVLLAQVEEVLASAEAGYATGRFQALDLLEAQHHLFEVRTAAARVRADLAIEWARLEGAVGGPVDGMTTTEGTSP